MPCLAAPSRMKKLSGVCVKVIQQAGGVHVCVRVCMWRGCSGDVL